MRGGGPRQRGHDDDHVISDHLPPPSPLAAPDLIYPTPMMMSRRVSIPPYQIRLAVCLGIFCDISLQCLASSRLSCQVRIDVNSAMSSCSPSLCLPRVSPSEPAPASQLLQMRPQLIIHPRQISAIARTSSPSSVARTTFDGPMAPDGVFK